MASVRACLCVLLLLIGACATRSPRPVAGPAAAAAADDADVDGDVEAVDDPVEASAAEAAPDGPCPKNMVLVSAGELRVCVDVYEASLVETDANGEEKPYPHWLAVDGHTVRAVSEPGVFPQGYISEVQADDACAASNKRLCTHVEWKTACMGPQKTTFPYGDARQPGTCHDTGKSAVGAVFGMRALADPVATGPARPRGSVAVAPVARPAGKAPASKTASKTRPPHTTHGKAAQTTRPRATREPATTRKPAAKKPAVATKRTPARASARPASVEPSVWSQLNDPRLGQVEGALSKTGSHAACINGWGAIDMVGNLHEWVKTDPQAVHGTFAGGYYLDTALNGDGCNYRTTAHAHDYHDYSTGFRCCADPER